MAAAGSHCEPAEDVSTCSSDGGDRVCRKLGKAVALIAMPTSELIDHVPIAVGCFQGSACWLIPSNSKSAAPSALSRGEGRAVGKHADIGQPGRSHEVL